MRAVVGFGFDCGLGLLLFSWAVAVPFFTMPAVFDDFLLCRGGLVAFGLLRTVGALACRANLAGVGVDDVFDASASLFASTFAFAFSALRRAGFFLVFLGEVDTGVFAATGSDTDVDAISGRLLRALSLVPCQALIWNKLPLALFAEVHEMDKLLCTERQKGRINTMSGSIH